MVRQLLTLILIVGVLGGGAYLAIYKRGEVAKKAKGYKTAETPQEAADQFTKAIKAREFTIAADYTTKEYQEQMKRGANAAEEFAVALDNLAYQLEQRGLMRDEVKLVFQVLDPFPKNIAVAVGKEANGVCPVEITFEVPVQRGDQPTSGSWKLKPELFQIYVRSLRVINNRVTVNMKKDGEEGWKLDLPSDTALQARVAYMNEKFKNYVNPFKLVTQEVKNDPTTKENATQRLKELLEKAAQE